MTAPRRVLHCMWHGDVGGAERAVYQLVREQMRDPEMAPAMLFAQGGGVYWEWAQKLGCPFITLDLPSGRALTRLPQIASAMRPFDLHHFHSAEPLLMLASLMCRKARRVYTHRGGLINYPLKKRAQYATVGLLLRLFFHALSGNTKHGARSGAKLYRLPGRRFQVTYNGLEFDLLEPQRPTDEVRDELGLRPNSYVIGTAANLKPWKRIERLLHAMLSLADPNARLLIVGDGVDRARLEAITDELGLRSQVIFTGRKEHVADYLQVVDAFCLPSMGLESFGNAAVEAMALGLPTIVFADGGGMVEHIKDSETGFIVPDQAELVETLRRLISNQEWGRAIGKQASRSVRERYTLCRAAASYKALYERAMGAAIHA